MPYDRKARRIGGIAMNLPQLYYFKKLAEVQHYSRAAKELYISQPTLSGAISSLEKELEVPLFEREGRSISLTSYGKVFYEYVRASLRELDDGIAAIHNRRNDAGGTVNLGTIFTIQDDYLPSLLSAFCGGLGHSVLIKTYQGFSNYLTQQLHEGSLDVAFCGKREHEPDIAYYPITYRNLMLCVRKDHPLAQRDRVSFADLASYELCSYRRGVPIGDRVFRMLEEHNVHNVSQVYDDDVSMGSYISFNNESAGALMLDSIGLKIFSNLTVVEVDEIPPHFYSIHLAYHKKRVRSQVVESFIEFAKNFEGNDPIDDVLESIDSLLSDVLSAGKRSHDFDDSQRS